MSFTTEKIKHNAKLVRLQLTDEMAANLMPEMDDMIKFINAIDEVDTAGIEPLVSVASHNLPIRKDSVKKTCTRGEVLKNATDATGEFFVVPKIIE